MLESALLMQTWLLGDGHPAVTDTIMITIRMLMARDEHALAVPMMTRVWELRTVIRLPKFDGNRIVESWVASNILMRKTKIRVHDFDKIKATGNAIAIYRPSRLIL